MEPYEGCNVGVGLTYGGGTLQQGLVIADIINEILIEDFDEYFGEAGLETFAKVNEAEFNLVMFQMYFVRGCDGPRERVEDE